LARSVRLTIVVVIVVVMVVLFASSASSHKAYFSIFEVFCCIVLFGTLDAIGLGRNIFFWVILYLVERE